MIDQVRVAVRLLIFVVFVCSFLLTGFCLRIFIKGGKHEKKWISTHVRFFSRLGCWLIGMRVNAVNSPKGDRHYLFVGNHLGILDILALASEQPTLFITSIEMKNTPGLGALCEMGGCVFVERRSRSQIPNEILNIRRTLADGVSVALYPEGTSHNGEKVHPFKKSFLVSVAGTNIPIKPVVINFRSVNGQPMSDRWRDHVCWYGDQTFFPTLLKILSTRTICVDLEFLDEVHVASEDQRREVAAHLFEEISKRYTPIL